jgi:hypothetical protein
MRKTMETSGELSAGQDYNEASLECKSEARCNLDENLTISSNILVCMVVKMGFTSQENNTMNFARQCWTEEIRGVLKL